MGFCLGNILEEISDGFKSYIEMDKYITSSEEHKELKKKFNHGFDLFRKYFSTFWD